MWRLYDKIVVVAFTLAIFIMTVLTFFKHIGIEIHFGDSLETDTFFINSLLGILIVYYILKKVLDDKKT